MNSDNDVVFQAPVENSPNFYTEVEGMSAALFVDI